MHSYEKYVIYLNSVLCNSTTINKESKPILFADDTSIIFTNSKSEDFKNDVNIVFESLNKCFEANKLSLNVDETYYIQFTTKNSGKLIWKSVMPTNLSLKHLIQNSLEYM
jgi:hypothetical protein